MSIFEFDDFRSYLRARNAQLPSNGRGEFRRMALHTKIHTTMISQIMRGDKNLSLEHAASLSQYLGFSSEETSYFLLLVQKDRAGTQELTKLLEEHIKERQANFRKLEKKLSPERKELNDAARGIFYSSWYYSAIRLMTAIPKFQNVGSMAQALGLSVSKVQEVVTFLKTHGLVIEEKSKLKIGPRRTHVSSHSSLASRHRVNWRLQAIKQMDHMKENDLSFTMPMGLAKDDIPKVTKVLHDAIQKIEKILEDSRPDTIAFVNLDCFQLLD